MDALRYTRALETPSRTLRSASVLVVLVRNQIRSVVIGLRDVIVGLLLNTLLSKGIANKLEVKGIRLEVVDNSLRDIRQNDSHLLRLDFPDAHI